MPMFRTSSRTLLVTTRTVIKMSQCWPWSWENLKTFCNRYIRFSLTASKTERDVNAFVRNAQFRCSEVQKASNPAFVNSWTEYPEETFGLVGGFHRLAMSFSLAFRFLLPYNLLWYSSICPLNVVIAASTKLFSSRDLWLFSQNKPFNSKR